MMPRPFMPPYQGFDALADAGVLDDIRAVAWPIAPRATGLRGPGRPVRAGDALLAEGVPVGTATRSPACA